jgi:8-oxo-dGTP pyrophosphatase MutT (NUDIX family)
VTLTERLRAALTVERVKELDLLTADLRELELDGTPPPAEAAVLIAVTNRTEPGVLLTQRTEHLRAHPGQIAFPGGRVDPDDADATAAALREAEEEIALDPAHVQVIGPVDRYRTGTGYLITPVLGVVPADVPLHAAEAEVADVFEVPLTFLLDAANHRAATAMWKGHERHFYEIYWQERRIWGATAAIIVNLSRRLAW